MLPATIAPGSEKTANCRSLLAAIVAAARLSPGHVHPADDVSDSNGVTIRYVTKETGEPVVLIHGWMGDSSTSRHTRPASN